MRAADDRFLCSGQVPVSTDVHKKDHRRAETPTGTVAVFVTVALGNRQNKSSVGISVDDGDGDSELEHC